MLEGFDDVDDVNDKELRARAKAVNLERLVGLLPLFRVFPDVRRLILFGSRARGDNQERSDIDLAVDAPDMDILTWDKLCSYIADNSNTLLPIDLIWLQHAPVGLANRIQSEGVVMFERKDKSIS